jgi:hypothetical protein
VPEAMLVATCVGELLTKQSVGLNGAAKRGRLLHADAASRKRRGIEFKHKLPVDGVSDTQQVTKQ